MIKLSQLAKTFRSTIGFILCDHPTVIRERRSNGLRLVCFACGDDLGPATFDETRSELARRLDRQQADAHKAKRRRERLSALERETESPKVRRIA